METKKQEPKAVLIEVCAGSYEDCLNAFHGGARRVELNSALSLGGLSPSPAVLEMVKKDTGLEVIAMVRPRAGGFCYSDYEKACMEREAEDLLRHGADGIAFGFLKEDGTIDEPACQAMIERIHAHGKTAVFHRAIDVTPDLDEAIETLIRLKADRILTSAQQTAAPQGIKTLARLQKKYGKRIEILPGSGIDAGNALKIVRETGIHQLHSSCRGYRSDPTTRKGAVSFACLKAPHEMDYEAADPIRIADLVQAVASD